MAGTRAKRKDRPEEHANRVEEVSERPVKRTPVSGSRDILTIRGADPNYEYRWVVDVSDSGQRIWKFKQASYTFVNDSELQGVGDNTVMKTENHGSIVAMPSGGGQTMYLMKIPKELYEMDQKAKHDEITRQERAMTESLTEEEGSYGKITLSRD